MTLFFGTSAMFRRHAGGQSDEKRREKIFSKRGTFSKGPPSKGTTTQMEALVLKREIW